MRENLEFGFTCYVQKDIIVPTFNFLVINEMGLVTEELWGFGPVKAVEYPVD